MSFEDRLHRAPSGCLEWTGAIGSHGYGVLTLSKPRRSVTAHRHAYEQAFGPVPPGMCVCHHCDNRKCCEPSHLFLGSHADNHADMDRKGRGYRGGAHQPVRGEHHYLAKLSTADVATIRRLSTDGEQGKALAARFGVSRSRISMIINGRSRTRA